jgi:hypothetical protein
MTVKMTGGLAQPVTAITGLAQLGTNGRKTRDTGRHSATEAELRGSASARTGQSKTPSELAPAGVSTWTTWRRRRDLNPRTPYGISTLAGPRQAHQGRNCRPRGTPFALKHTIICSTGTLGVHSARRRQSATTRVARRNCPTVRSCLFEPRRRLWPTMPASNEAPIRTGGSTTGTTRRCRSPPQPLQRPGAAVTTGNDIVFVVMTDSRRPSAEAAEPIRVPRRKRQTQRKIDPTRTKNMTQGSSRWPINGSMICWIA